ncbi:1-acyl-sn-glycerol-3-phosphate acyltransferases [Parasphingorhabdus marina DSM 22363]|uniref:1-acyl-sn-glycerol-3-phosphate acyltransferases n=1 Tax=Parasphingorhabdus marina DSM 22363 TaxID=1123272 RepID=A0A1N6GMI4_9SPHN|nr:1-acyl-sn-glycerol-3-phosphate acyltransferase [Parasphingorhabdus marina]SIO08713.1 1-acyl-sn-glycerol-3-phosphate acyltransferases [Parasphingorhabdus marina DSM 22363]
MKADYDNILSASSPRMGNRFTRWLGRFILRCIGWKMVGKLPSEKKLIIVGMPHTSNWDFILAMACMQSVGLKVSFMMKREAFRWPLGTIFKYLGGVPIDRSRQRNVTSQMVNWFDRNENVWLGLTPEGTRSKVRAYKKGYLRISKAAGVPIALIGIDARSKEVVLHEQIWEYTGTNNDEDNAAIKSFVDANFFGINPKNQ